MADLSITAAQVLPGPNCRTDAGIAGAAITPGQLIYKSSTDRLWYLTDADSATVEARVPAGLAMNTAAAGQPVAYAKPGSEVILGAGASMTLARGYYTSPTAGGIAVYADLGTGDQVSICGIAKSASLFLFDVMNSEVVL